MNKIIKKAAVILTIFAMLISAVPVYAASVSISKKSVTLYIGQSTALKVKGQNGKVSWKSANPKVATVNKSGVVTAKKAGKTKVTAKVNKKTLTCNITVKKAVKVKKITLKKNISLNVGESYTLKANISPSSAANKKVSWKSSNKSIAVVNAAGVVKAKRAGSATITATAKDGSGKKAYCKVTVKKKTSGSQTEERVKSLSLNGKTILGIGNTVKFSVVYKPENLKKSFSWNSSNPKIATVSSDGTVKAMFSVPLYAPSVTITVLSSCLSICPRCSWINWLSLWLFCPYWYSVTTEPLAPTDSSRLAAYPRCSFPALFRNVASGSDGFCIMDDFMPPSSFVRSLRFSFSIMVCSDRHLTNRSYSVESL